MAGERGRIQADEIRMERSPEMMARSAQARCLCTIELNERPRKTLNYFSPGEKFEECVAVIG